MEVERYVSHHGLAHDLHLLAGPLPVAVVLPAAPLHPQLRVEAADRSRPRLGQDTGGVGAGVELGVAAGAVSAEILMMEWRWCALSLAGDTASRSPRSCLFTTVKALVSCPPLPALRRDLGAETGVSRLDSNLARLELELRTESVVVCGTAGKRGISSSVSPIETVDS